MEWLLILYLNFSHKEAKIEDNRFPTYEACMLAVGEVLNHERTLVLCEKDEKKEEAAESVIQTDLTKPVVRFEYSCRKVKKEKPKRCDAP